MDERDVLREAAKVIMRDGWHQGNARGPNGERCLVAAMTDAAGDDMYLLATARNYLRGWIYDNFGVYGLVAFNEDDSSRTAEDVILALKLAAED